MNLYLPAVEVDGVAHRLEHEERDAYRQEDVPESQYVVPGKVVRYLYEEIGIFEIGEHTEIYQYAQRNKSPPVRLRLGGSQQPSDDKIGHGYKYQQEKIETAGLVIKINRKEGDIDHAQHGCLAHERVEQSEPCKEKKEYPAAEYHRAGRIVSQQFGNGLRYAGNIDHLFSARDYYSAAASVSPVSAPSSAGSSVPRPTSDEAAAVSPPAAKETAFPPASGTSPPCTRTAETG